MVCLPWVFPLPPMVNLNPDGISAQHAAMVKSLVELRSMCRSVRQRQWHLETLRVGDAFCVLEHPGVQIYVHMKKPVVFALISREMSMKFTMFDECLMNV